MEMTSPNEMMEAAKKIMLDGKEPETERDWQLIVNFVAHNIVKGLELSVCRLFKTMYEIPLDDAVVAEIARLQAQDKD